MTSESCFDKNNCCLSSRSLCVNFKIYTILSSILVAIQVGISILLYCYVLDISGSIDSLHNILLYIHAALFGLSLLMISFIGRYLSGSSHRNAIHHSYLMGGCYLLSIFFTWTLFALSIVVHSDSKRWKIIVDRSYMMLLINFYSFSILWLLICIFKPIIRNDNYYNDTNHDQGHFIRRFTEYVFYETKKDTKDIMSSSQSIAILFFISMITVNIAIGFYNVEPLYYNMLVGLSTSLCILSLLIQIPIIITYYKCKMDDKLDTINYGISLILWLVFIFFWIIISIPLFFLHFPYNGIGSVMDMTSFVILMIQGVICLVVFVVSLLTIIIKGIMKCCKCCKCCKYKQNIVNRQVEQEVEPLIQ